MKIQIQLGKVKADHCFIVVRSLITPVIVGVDFMQKHGLVLDFTTTPVTIHDSLGSNRCPPELEPLLEKTKAVKMKVSAVSYTSQSPDDAVDDYAVPIFDTKNPSHDLLHVEILLFYLLLKLIKSYFKIPQAIPWL